MFTYLPPGTLARKPCRCQAPLLPPHPKPPESNDRLSTHNLSATVVLRSMTVVTTNPLSSVVLLRHVATFHFVISRLLASLSSPHAAASPTRARRMENRGHSYI
jgi:hypothetical protein